MKPQPSSAKSKDKFDMTHPKCDCGGRGESETFPGSLRFNFRTHNQLFPEGDTKNVQYALDHLGSWVNYPVHTQRETVLTDSVTCGHELLADDHTCLHDSDLCVTQIWELY